VTQFKYKAALILEEFSYKFVSYLHYLYQPLGCNAMISTVTDVKRQIIYFLLEQTCYVFNDML